MTKQLIHLWHAFSSGSLNRSLPEISGTVGDGNGVWCAIASELHEISVFPGGCRESWRLGGSVKIANFTTRATSLQHLAKLWWRMCFIMKRHGFGWICCWSVKSSSLKPKANYYILTSKQVSIMIMVKGSCIFIVFCDSLEMLFVLTQCWGHNTVFWEGFDSKAD